MYGGITPSQGTKTGTHRSDDLGVYISEALTTQRTRQ